MQCEMCGTDDELFKTNIEGISINVCKKCSKYGKVISKVDSYMEPAISGETRKIKTPPAKKVETETVFVIMPDFAKKIKDAREKLGLKQDELGKKLSERDTLIHKFETGAVEPTITVARKLEKFLSIKLVEEHTEATAKGGDLKPGEITLGDMIKIRKRP